MSLPKYLPWVICAVMVLGCLVAVPVMSLGTWYFFGGRPEAVGKQAEAADPYAKWGWQELQDHMAKRGLKTSRGMVGGQMWFAEGDGTPLSSPYVQNIEASRHLSMDRGWFWVDDRATAESAKAEVARLADAEQKTALAWHRFVFHAAPQTQAVLKKLL